VYGCVEIRRSSFLFRGIDSESARYLCYTKC
jgi:hypothetical protein